MKPRIIHLVSADADRPLLRSVAALHLAERRLGADSLLLTSAPVGGAGPQRRLPVAGRSLSNHLALGRLPGWLRRLFPLPPEAAADTFPQLAEARGLTDFVTALHPDAVHLHAVRSEIGSVQELAALPGKLCWSIEDRFWMKRAASLPREAAEALMKRDLQLFFAVPKLADEALASPLFQGRTGDVVLPTVDPATFHPDPERRARFRRKLGAEKSLIVMTDGRELTPFLAEVLAELRKNVKEGVLLLALHEPQLRLPCPVRLVADDGGFSRQLADAYRAADCWLDAGDEKTPVLPLALLEAAACGTPALAQDGSLGAALIAPEWSGLRVKSRTVPEWVRAVLEVRSDCDGYGAAASEQVFTSHSPLNAARRLLTASGFDF